MAKGNTYKCSTCGKTYTHCPQCEAKNSSYDKERYCSKTHSEIFDILSRHGCGLATAEETLKQLEKFNLDSETLSPSISKHIAALKAEVKPAIPAVQVFHRRHRSDSDVTEE